jgi:hypothetical protein
MDSLDDVCRRLDFEAERDKLRDKEMNKLFNYLFNYLRGR